MNYLDSLDFVAIDFETANTYSNSACSIGLVRYINGKETDSVSSLIQPAKMYFIQEWTDTIHHISYKDVRGKPKYPEVWQTLIKPFLDKTPGIPFVAHNASFDMGVIKGCCDYYSLEYPTNPYFDSLKLSRTVWPELKNHKLTYLGEHFGIDYLAHDALEDSRTCGLVVNKAIEHKNAENLGQLLTCCNMELRLIG